MIPHPKTDVRLSHAPQPDSSLRTILIGLDGSSHSTAAIQLGIEWSRRFGSMLVGVGVIDDAALRPQQPLNSSYERVYDDLVAGERRDVEQYLEQFAIRCSESEIPFKLLEDTGAPAEEILREAQRYDVILFGRQTHFRAGNHNRTCKTLEKVVRNSPRPVVTVPETLHEAQGGGVLLAFDGSAPASRAVQAFLSLGLARLGNVNVVCVHPTSKLEAARTAHRAIEYLDFHDVTATSIPLAGNHSASELFIQRAEELRCDLIVMGAYGQPRLTEFFLGSTTCAALKESPVPLLLFH